MNELVAGVFRTAAPPHRACTPALAPLLRRHPEVQSLMFSPCEQYLLTFSEFPDNRGRPHVSAWQGSQ